MKEEKIVDYKNKENDYKLEKSIMSHEPNQIWEYIDRFRKSQYFQEVIGQGYLVGHT